MTFGSLFAGIGGLDLRTQVRGRERCRILRRLTPEQRKRYEAECRIAPRHRNGKLYDEARARIAERIIYEDRVSEDASGPCT